MFRASSCPSSGAYQLQQQPLVYSRNVVVAVLLVEVGPVVCRDKELSRNHINPLKAELNPICHLLVLLGDLTFMGPCIVSIFQYTCISNMMQCCTVYLYLETALHVSGGTSTHHQGPTQPPVHWVLGLELYLYSRYGPYGLYRASVLVQ
jgi:hypothetical protein